MLYSGKSGQKNTDNSRLKVNSVQKDWLTMYSHPYYNLITNIASVCYYTTERRH